jgi:hypothetical protein
MCVFAIRYQVSMLTPAVYQCYGTNWSRKELSKYGLWNSR